MHALTKAVMWMESADAFGELLRELTFPGEGYGCYSTREVRGHAVEWPRQRRVEFWRTIGYCDPDYPEGLAEQADSGEGYTWKLDDLTVHVCWFWDGDGVLAFDARAGDLRRVVINGDCKKYYRWEEVEPA